MVEADVVEVMVALPGQLFFNTQIPACLWFLARPPGENWGEGYTRQGQVLFIDARKLGRMVSRAMRAERRRHRLHRQHRTCVAYDDSVVVGASATATASPAGDETEQSYADIPVSAAACRWQKLPNTATC